MMGRLTKPGRSVLELNARDERIVGVKLARNHGHQLALTAGLHVCRGERILIIDADLQDPPELLGRMMQLMDMGADVVYGQRIERHGETLFKRVSASLFYRLLNILVDPPIPVDTGDFRLISRRAVLDFLNSMPERHRFLRGMVSWVGFTQVPLRYERDERLAGETKYPLRKDGPTGPRCRHGVFDQTAPDSRISRFAVRCLWARWLLSTRCTAGLPGVQCKDGQV